MMTDSRQLCCCGVDSWAKVIAWFQIILSGVCGVFLLGSFFILVSVGEDKVDEMIDQTQNPELIPYKEFGFGMLIAVIVFTLVFSIISMWMGIMLLKGVKERNTKWLTAWIVFIVIYLIFIVASKLIIIDTNNIPEQVVRILMSVGILGFCIWVVQSHKMEILSTQGLPYKACN